MGGCAARHAPQPLSGSCRPSCATRSASTSASRPSGCSAPTARTRCCRRCCSPTAAPGDGGGVRADVRAALAHRSHHRDRGGRRGAHGRLHDRRRRGRALLAEHRPASCSCAAPTTRPARSSPRPRSRRSSTRLDGLVVVDEAYGEFADRSAIELVADDRPLIVARTYSKVWSMAALRLGFCVAPPWVVEELEKVVLPYHLAVPTQLAGVPPSASGARWTTASRPWSRAGAARAELDKIDGVTVFPSGANFVLLRARRRHALWERLVDARRARARLLAWPRLAGACGSPSVHRRRTTPFSPRCCGGCRGGESRMSRSSQQTARRRRPRSRSRSTSTARARRAPTGIPFFDHMLEQLGKHGGLDLRIEAEGDLEVDLHHTIEDVGIVLGTGASRGAGRQGGRAPVRQRGRAARRSARPGRARPLRAAVPRLRGRPEVRVDRHVRPAADRGVLEGLRRRPGSRCTCAHSRARTVTTSSRRRSRASPAACATR